MIRLSRLAATCALAVLGTSAWAAVPTDASLRELMDVSGVEQTYLQMPAMMRDGVLRAMKFNPDLSRLNARQQQIVADAQDQLGKIVVEEMTSAQMQGFIVQTYQHVFTQEEVDGLIAFYRSPVGRAWVAKMPQANQRLMELVQQQVMPRVLQRVGEVFRQMKTDLRAAQTAD